GLIPPLPPTRYGPRDSIPDPDPEPLVASMPPPGTPPGIASVAPSVAPAATVSGAIDDGASIGAGTSRAGGNGCWSVGCGVTARLKPRAPSLELAGFGSLARDGARRTSDVGLAATIAGITTDERARTTGT